ncbi:MAG: hypothetical protein MRECE_16c028 [Mycoplasmataceae bacterium CE_OT135]|nr:MAG: hypothetical protein MRECE_16c028 [Mycoplasmataceae bacterium CE_OT135]
MINLQQLRNQIQNQLPVNFENNKFYYQNQNPQVPNGFAPIDQINNFDQVRNNLKTHNTTTRTTYTTAYRQGVIGSHTETRYRQETRYRSETRTREAPYSVPTGEVYCSRGDHPHTASLMDFEPTSGWCDTCQDYTESRLHSTGNTTHYRTETYTEQVPYQANVPYQETVNDYGNVPYQVPNNVTTTNWNAVKQSLEQQFTPPNQNEYSFVYWNTGNEPDLAQIYQSTGGDQFKIVLRTTQRNDSDFDAWKVTVEQKLRERRFDALFSQQFQQIQNQANNLVQARDNAINERNARPDITILEYNDLLNEQTDLHQERDNLQTDLERERQERADSRERRQREFDARLASDREVLGDNMGEEQVAHIVQNQELRWRNMGGNN